MKSFHRYKCHVPRECDSRTYISSLVIRRSKVMFAASLPKFLFLDLSCVRLVVLASFALENKYFKIAELIDG